MGRLFTSRYERKFVAALHTEVLSSKLCAECLLRPPHENVNRQHRGFTEFGVSNLGLDGMLDSVAARVNELSNDYSTVKCVHCLVEADRDESAATVIHILFVVRLMNCRIEGSAPREYVLTMPWSFVVGSGYQVSACGVCVCVIVCEQLSVCLQTDVLQRPCYVFRYVRARGTTAVVPRVSHCTRPFSHLSPSQSRSIRAARHD